MIVMMSDLVILTFVCTIEVIYILCMGLLGVS